ncbi:MAG: nucleotide exchange factor GrpE, partial [Sulfuricurvum sp.]|nr:nucleotide exchange factor GrpE [Sulfuricurvum sp.]
MSNEVNEEVLNDTLSTEETVEESVAQELNELETIQAELASFKDKYARVHAD